MVIKTLSVLIRAYQIIISPALLSAFGTQCRYEESCSHYMERALRERGALRGSLIGIRRILSCTNWSPHG